MRSLCGTLTRPQVTQMDGNLYVRGGEGGARTLLVWSPVAGENCVAEFKTLAELQGLHPELETRGRVLNADLRSVFSPPGPGSLPVDWACCRACRGRTPAR